MTAARTELFPSLRKCGETWGVHLDLLSIINMMTLLSHTSALSYRNVYFRQTCVIWTEKHGGHVDLDFEFLKN